jgi:hypothetical protein
MGLLDDAIREHLEFKRLHGADPSEVAREEQEALGPVDRGQNSALEEPANHAEDMAEDREPHSEKPPAPAEALPSTSTRPLHTGQETAELDMRTVLRAEQPGEGEGTAGDSLEWEAPTATPDKPPEQGEDDKPAAADDPGGAVEDVLEETPDFLRETPDQERLWFEQQPPRDFDFDK